MGDLKSDVPIQDCDTADELLRELRLTERRGWLSDGSWASDWIFRGQKEANKWKLQASVWRKNENGDDTLAAMKQRFFSNFDLSFEDLINERVIQVIRSQYASKCGSFEDYFMKAGFQNRERFIDLLKSTIVEANAIYEFVQVADEVGYRVLNQHHFRPWEEVVERHINSVYDEEPNPLRPTFQIWDGRNHAGVALAQHHGIPTALLDWTRNPLIAAFFAAHEIDPKNSDDQEGRIAVWALRTNTLEEGLDTRHFRLKKVVIPRSEHPYLHAQNSLFIYDSGADKHYLEHGEWPSIQDAIKDEQYTHIDSPLLKFTLPKKQAGELLRLLWAEGVSIAHLMPTFDNVAKALQKKWQWMDSRKGLL